jgi:hypothetical protein
VALDSVVLELRKVTNPWAKAPVVNALKHRIAASFFI